MFATKEWIISLIKKAQEMITPMGTVISYMGTTAPKGYLICDGTVYNIADYPTFANFIKTQFGKYNFFGGDGTSTFAVPDLRGEFLRGTGTNSHIQCGSGAASGVHQEPTHIPHIIADGDAFEWVCAKTTNDGIGDFKYADSGKYFNTAGTGAGTVYKYNTVGTVWKEYKNDYYDHVSTRPTNTSVLYCIKYI